MRANSSHSPTTGRSKHRPRSIAHRRVQTADRKLNERIVEGGSSALRRVAIPQRLPSAAIPWLEIVGCVDIDFKRQHGPSFVSGTIIRGASKPTIKAQLPCFHKRYRANSNSRRQSDGSRRSLRLVTPSRSPCCLGGCTHHGDRGDGDKPNFRARKAMSTSDENSGRKVTTARPPVA